MRVIGVIPARGGSKGIPRKNIRPLCGRPLLEYTVEAARGAQRLSRVILTTDDEEIAAAGRACGVEVPFLRPRELAADETPMLPVIQHAVRWLEAHGEEVDAVCILQPTTPLRRAEDIDGCIELLERTGCDAVVSCLPVPPEYNPHWVCFRDPDGSLRWSLGGERPVIGRRQDLPQAVHRDGSVYVTRREVLITDGTLYGRRLMGYVMDPARSVNLDRPEDWERAERLLRQVLHRA